MTAKLSRYLFDTSFDVEDADAAIDGGAAAVEGTPAPSTYTEDDLKAARDEALASGEAAGREAALGAVESQLQEALDRLVRQVGRLLEDQRRFNGEVVEQAVRMALKVVRKMLPELARRNGLAEIEAVLRRCLSDVPDEPRIVVRIDDALLDPLKARIDAIADGQDYQGAIVLLAEPGMGPADCKIEWADGGAQRMTEGIWRDVDRAVDRAFAHGATPPPSAGGAQGSGGGGHPDTSETAAPETAAPAARPVPFDAAEQAGAPSGGEPPPTVTSDDAS